MVSYICEVPTGEHDKDEISGSEIGNTCNSWCKWNVVWMLQVTSTGLHCVRVYCVAHNLIHRQDTVYLKNVFGGSRCSNQVLELQITRSVGHSWPDMLSFTELCKKILTQSWQDASIATMIPTVLQMCMFCCAQSCKNKFGEAPVHVLTRKPRVMAPSQQIYRLWPSRTSPLPWW